MQIAIPATVLVLMILGGYFAYRIIHPDFAAVTGHRWTSYQNAALAISFEYPSDLLLPAPPSALPEGDSASTSVIFTKDATTTPTQRGFSPHIVVTFEPTNEPDAASYIASHGFQIANGLGTTTTINGVPAVAVSQTAYAQETLYAVFDRRFYTIAIDLPPAETARVIDSLQFGTVQTTPSERCDQSATTTDCSKISPLAQPEPQPYVPPDPSQPTETWNSATGTPISLYGFSFELPAGWHGSVYRSAYTGNVHALVQSESNGQGFTIDCPPSGKGLEAATRLSSEERLFSAGGLDYAIAFEQWAAPGTDSWYFLWVRTAHDPSGTYCLAQGTSTPDVAQAMQTMFATWSAAN